jgi:16S rRNA processing protein RimM
MVTIGKVERPFGVRGAVKVRSLSDRPGRFEQLEVVRVAGQAGNVVERTVRNVRKAGSAYIVQFEGITTPEEAGTLRGAWLQVPRAASLEPEEMLYQCDLIGMTVTDDADRELGVIDAIWELPGHQVFVVTQDGREVLIPAVKEFVKIVDVGQRRMVVRHIDDMVEV